MPQTLSPSPYFPKYTYEPQQALIEDLLETAMKQNGTVIKYIPRTVVERDQLFGDDPYTEFNLAVNLDAYVDFRNVTGFGGQDVVNRFAFFVSDSITFTITRRKWEQIKTEKLLMENNYIYQQESFKKYSYNSSVSFKLEEGNGTQYSITFDKPRPGDLIYFPEADKLFEITFVEHEELFYQFGRLYTYDLQCQLFKYSSEKIDTGNINIDEIEDMFSTDISNDSILIE